MIFNSFAYFLLLGLSVAVFFLVPTFLRRWIIVISGVVFYTYFGGIYVLLILGELFCIYVLTKKTQFKTFISALIVSLGILFLFKYREYIHLLVGSITSFIQLGLDIPIGRLVMPLAISFFTFEFVHIIIDRYNGKLKKFSFVDAAAFVFFFPSLVAGPIKRFEDFIPQIEKAQLSSVSISAGIFRILIGLFKKLVIADTFVVIRGSLLTNIYDVSSMTVIGGWVGLFCFAMQIYFDFSGYSDIAIGSGRLFGITIPENFNFPYLQSNIRDFWRNWHMTLTRWITDYIYIPLGGSRKMMLIVCANTLITMTVSGIWHGATANFFLWGVYHGILLALYRVYSKIDFPFQMPVVLHPYFRLLSIGVTFFFVSLGWLLFMAPLEVAISALTKMIGVT